MICPICPNCRFSTPNYCWERSAGINRKETEKQKQQREKKEEEKEKETSVQQLNSTTATCFVADLLVSHNYINNDSSFINVPTVVHEPTVFQSAHRCSNIQFADSETMKPSCDAQILTEQNSSLTSPINQSNQNPFIMGLKNYGMAMKYVTTTCNPTNDSITFHPIYTSPNMHSGGCLIQNTEAGILVQTSPIDIQRKLTGGSCLMQKKHFSNEDERLVMFKYVENFAHQTLVTSQSGYLELPENRRIPLSSRPTRENNETMSTESRQRKILTKTNDCCDCNSTIQQNICQCHKKLTDTSDDCGSLLFEPVGNGMQIRVNANMQLPVNLNDCQIDITATTAMPCSQIVTMKPFSRNKQEQNEETKEEKQKKEKEEKKEKEIAIHSTTATCYLADLLVSSKSYINNNDSFINIPTIAREPTVFQSAHCFNAQFANSETVELSNNFSKSVTVKDRSDNLYCATENRIITTGNNNGCNNNERKERAPTISVPHPCVMSSPWRLDTKLLDKNGKLRKIKRLLQTCGWYHENISWKQSENLLKNTSVGRWLMRDSSDSRYIFAISVQTARGPTSVRVCYFLKHFQFDAEPGLALAIPTFDCPITMLEHYVEYSERMDRREVWVDYSGELYSQIYLTKPLIKEVKSLSHLARLVVNRNKLPTEHLPLFIRNYLAEYPYTL
ncbi:hypothetical protein ACFW04_002956 [Cataglyphis niger]